VERIQSQPDLPEVRPLKGVPRTPYREQAGMTNLPLLDYLGLIPLVLALAFLLWVLWNFTKERRG